MENINFNQKTGEVELKNNSTNETLNQDLGDALKFNPETGELEAPEGYDRSGGLAETVENKLIEKNGKKFKLVLNPEKGEYEEFEVKE